MGDISREVMFEGHQQQDDQYSLFQAEQYSLFQGEQNALFQAEQNALFQADQNPLFQAEQNPLFQAEQNPLFQAEQSPLFQAEQNPLFQAEQNPLFQDEQYPLFQAEQYAFQTFSDEQRSFREDFVIPTDLVSDPINGSRSVEEEDIHENNPASKRRGQHQRHTEYQIQRLETYFRELQYPNDIQRRDLGVELGLEPAQIKFWFQNKRSLMKNQKEKMDNQRLKEENDKLIVKNNQLKEALGRALICSNCSGSRVSSDEHQLRIENALLQDQINERRSAAAAAAAANYSAQGMTPNQNVWSAGTSYVPNNYGL